MHSRFDVSEFHCCRIIACTRAIIAAGSSRVSVEAAPGVAVSVSPASLSVSPASLSDSVGLSSLRKIKPVLIPACAPTSWRVRPFTGKIRGRRRARAHAPSLSLAWADTCTHTQVYWHARTHTNTHEKHGHNRNRHNIKDTLTPNNIIPVSTSLPLTLRPLSPSHLRRLDFLPRWK